MTDDAQSRLEEKIDYLQPDVPGSLPWLKVPLVQATDQSLEGYGQLVDDYQDFPIEIVRWLPVAGGRWTLALVTRQEPPAGFSVPSGRVIC